MPTAESPSPSSYYTLWMCPHHPRPHFTHRVQNLTSKTRFSKETFITVGLYMISRFFWCVIFEVWIKGSPEMQLLISRSFKHYFPYEIDGINYQYVCSLSTWTEVCHKTNKYSSPFYYIIYLLYLLYLFSRNIPKTTCVKHKVTRHCLFTWRKNRKSEVRMFQTSDSQAKQVTINQHSRRIQCVTLQVSQVISGVKNV